MRKVIFLIALVALLLWFVHYLKTHRSYLDFNENVDYLYQKKSLKTDFPLIIHQTYKSVSLIPEKVRKNIKTYAPEFEHIVYDDETAKDFLAEHFHWKVLQAFESLKLGAHKADLFRYCVIYAVGGVYLDVKTQLINPIRGLFPPDNLTTVISRNKNEIYQGVIAAKPGKKIFLHLISAILKSGPSPAYSVFIRDFMKYLKHDTKNSNLHEGVFIGNENTYTLFTEKCTANLLDCSDGLDRYGRCCQITNNNKNIIKTRYSDYPW